MDEPQKSVSIAEAARILNLSEDGVRKRIKRGVLHATKVTGVWQVVVDASRSEKTDSGSVQNSSGRLVDHLQNEVEFLRTQLAVKDQQISELRDDIYVWREQARYKDLLLARLEDRLIQLPSPAEPEPPEQEPELSQAARRVNEYHRSIERRRQSQARQRRKPRKRPGPARVASRRPRSSRKKPRSTSRRSRQSAFPRIRIMSRLCSGML